jgi:hypothetical protein
MTAYKNKLRLTQLEFLFIIFNLITQRQIIYVNSIYSYNANLEKANKLTNTSRSFPLLSEFWMRYTPLTWCEQEDLRHNAHLESLPRALGFYVSSRRRLDHKDTACRSYRSVYQFIKSINQRY